jgi:hypothetical protein
MVQTITFLVPTSMIHGFINCIMWYLPQYQLQYLEYTIKNSEVYFPYNILNFIVMDLITNYLIFVVYHYGLYFQLSFHFLWLLLHLILWKKLSIVKAMFLIWDHQVCASLHNVSLFAMLEYSPSLSSGPLDYFAQWGLAAYFFGLPWQLLLISSSAAK